MMWPKHAKGMFFIGLLVVIAGAVPLLKDVEFLKQYLEIIPSGLIYQIIIIVIGLLAMFLGKPEKGHALRY